MTAPKQTQTPELLPDPLEARVRPRFQPRVLQIQAQVQPQTQPQMPPVDAQVQPTLQKQAQTQTSPEHLVPQQAQTEAEPPTQEQPQVQPPAQVQPPRQVQPQLQKQAQTQTCPQVQAGTQPRVQPAEQPPAQPPVQLPVQPPDQTEGQPPTQPPVPASGQAPVPADATRQESPPSAVEAEAGKGALAPSRPGDGTALSGPLCPPLAQSSSAWALPGTKGWTQNQVWVHSHQRLQGLGCEHRRWPWGPGPSGSGERWARETARVSFQAWRRPPRSRWRPREAWRSARRS